MKYNILTFLLLMISVVTLSSQNILQTKHQISWTGIETLQTDKAQKKVLSFTDASYPAENDLPYFVQTISWDKNYDVDARIENPVYTSLTSEEIKLLDNINLSETPEISTYITEERGNSYLNIQILPLIKLEGKVKKLTSFELNVTKTSKSFKAPAAIHSYVSSSVLATGKFVKIKIKESGIYKLTYEALNSMGVNPGNVRIFGYGGALLEQSFLLPKPDDLPEVAVWMEKGSDGVFNAGDYILFYGQGIVKWKYDPAKAMFVHTLNHYSNDAFYFVTSDAGTGKKIADQTIDVPADAIVADVNEFTDYQLYELEKQNLAQTGKVFYGETFSDVVSYNFPFTFTNVVKTASTKVRIDVAAISSENSTFTLKLNDDQPQNVTVIKKSVDNYEIGKDANAVLNFTPSADNLIFNLTYNKPTTVSRGFLNYLEINARRSLTMIGAVMFFRNTDNLNTATYNRYQLSGAGPNVQIWDITDRLNIKKVITTRSNNVLEFKDTNSSLKEYVAIDPTAASAFQQPTTVGAVPNQNLHALAPTEMVILTHPTFVAQAEKLAQAHRVKDNMTVAVVTTEQVYNEFSSGTPDATSYRWVMKMLYDRAIAAGNTSAAPKYLLLFGRGSFDNRGIILNSGNNLILTYQADMSLDVVKSYVTDDYFGFLDDNEGLQIASHLLDVGIGRFPVVTPQQADDVVNKTISYMENKENGNWKNQLCFLADDGDGALHMRQADSIASLVSRSNPGFQYNKIYLDAYLQEVAASGESYPLAHTRFHNMLRSGIFMLNYTGHASQLGWTNEQILTTADVKQMYNTKLPFWIGATCDFILFDVKDISAGEHVVLNPAGGGIGLFSAARTVYASQNEKLNRYFTVNLFTKPNGKYYRLGDVMARAKNQVGTEINKLSYTLLGDPALRLNYPTDYNVVTEKINNRIVQAADTLRALSVNSIEGYIADGSGNRISEFNGNLEVTIYDKMQKITTLNNHNDGTLTYNDRPNILYSGKAKIQNGNFSFTFMVPRDIKYNYGSGRISYYASDSLMHKEAQGYYENFIVGGGTNIDLNADQAGPELKVYLNSENFVSGGKVNESPLFFAKISDVNGVNTVGSGIGHDLRLVVDDNQFTSYTLNDYFEAETNSYKSGSVRYKLPLLPAGKHTLTFHAWDLLNNSSQATLDFEVVVGLTPTIFKVYNFPNPVRNETRFVVEHDRPETILETTVDLYDMTGRKIWSMKKNSVENLKWNRADASLQQVKPGIYIYKISVKTANSEQTSKANKIIVTGQ